MWVFIISNSSGVSFPGFSRIVSEIEIFPTSCNGDACTIISISFWVSPYSGHSSFAHSARIFVKNFTRLICAPDSTSRNSTTLPRDSIIFSFNRCIFRVWRMVFSSNAFLCLYKSMMLFKRLLKLYVSIGLVTISITPCANAFL